MIRLFKILSLSAMCCASLKYGVAQKASKAPHFGNEISMADSTSTIMIPILYNNENLFTSDKIVTAKEVYANIIFYNFVTDSTRMLFKQNTFIEQFATYDVFTRARTTNQNVVGQYIFYKVYNVDYDRNGRIDPGDPGVLYVSDHHGNNLKALTPTNEHVVSMQIFKNQQFILLKMQRDEDNDHDFEPLFDNDYYYVKLDLKTFSLGKKITL